MTASGEDPLFSVVIPTYNRAGLIGKTLDSVMAQTYSRFEVIVVDNCSTDGTEQVLEPYTRTGVVRLIRHDRNYERARSRNTGLENAVGDWVTFLDSDDLMYPDNLRDAAAYAASHAEIRCFHNLYELVDEQGRLLYRYSFPSLRDHRRAIAYGNFLSCIGDFLHRDVYTTARFDVDPSMAGSEDWDFWIRVAADHTIGRIHKVNSGIVDHSGRTVNNQDLEKLQVRIDRILSKVSSDPHLSAVYGRHLRFMKASARIYMAGVANSCGQYERASRLLREAFCIDLRIVPTLRFLRTWQIALFQIDQMAQLRGAKLALAAQPDAVDTYPSRNDTPDP